MSRWPRCGFRYVTSPDDVRAGRWRLCQRRMGHWVNRSRHEGPPCDPPRRLRGVYPREPVIDGSGPR
jgi:hypothetical protein